MKINSLGDLLKEKRLERGLSLKDVEANTTITSSYIHRLENGSRKNPSSYVAQKLSAFYGIQEKTFIELATNSLTNEEDNFSYIIEDTEVKLLLNCILKRITTLIENK